MERFSATPESTFEQPHIRVDVQLLRKFRVGVDTAILDANHLADPSRGGSPESSALLTVNGGSFVAFIDRWQVAGGDRTSTPIGALVPGVWQCDTLEDEHLST
ncbi:MAG: hypothetical protein QOD05_613 [Microbacteriaceae bacterium]|jgi:hypothetical protein|nr:hypothetical protein [Microbacteriaceae bacterium]